MQDEFTPIRLAELLHECPGKWAALRNGEIIEVADTFDGVALALRGKQISNATIIRAPAEGESEMVGLG